MRLPQDIANLLAVAIRDVLWFKNAVFAFYKDCEVPRPLLAEVKKQQQAGTPTIKTVHDLLDSLDSYGEEGWVTTKHMLTKMNYWKDLHSIPPERRATAERSLAALRDGTKEFQAQQAYEERKAQEQRERAMQAERLARGQITALDHAKLQNFRDEFDAVYILKDPKQRGDRFEILMNEIFAH